MINEINKIIDNMFIYINYMFKSKKKYTLYITIMSQFDSDQWINEKKLELINILFRNEFGINDFKNSSSVINFDDLQTEAVKTSIGKYRPAMGVLFKAEDIRSILNYYYSQQDKKPVLNLLKQILKYYGYEFSRTSEYQGNYAGKKVYKSRYTIIPIKKSNLNSTDDQKNIDEDDELVESEDTIDTLDSASIITPSEDIKSNDHIQTSNLGNKPTINKKKLVMKLVQNYNP